MKEIRLLILGYYGFGNLGDELILSSMLKELRDFEITVLYHKSGVSHQMSSVRKVDRNSFFKIIREVSKTDLLISGGGGLFQDTSSLFSLLYYLGIIALALILRKPVLLYGAGIGPLRRKISRWLVRKTLNRTLAIMVRDRSSLGLLRELAIDKPNICLTADPVLSLGIKRPANVGTPGSSDPQMWVPRDQATCKCGYPGLRVAFCLRQWKGLEERLIGVVSQAGNWLVENLKADVVLIPFQPSLDLNLSSKIKEKIKEAVLIEPSKEEALEIIGGFDLIIGMRLHSLILAAIAEVPMIGLSYDPKVESFLEEVGQSVLRIEDLTPKGLIERIDEVLEKRILYRQKLKKRLLGLQEKSLQNGEITRKILKTY